MPEQTIPYKKPLPVMTGLTKEFYDHCKRHQLSFQRCLNCSAWRHVPQDMCALCNSMKWEWAPSTGRGRVYTWFVAHRPLFPEFGDDVPYAVGVIEMEEGVRLAAQIIDCPPDEIRFDMSVQVAYDDVTPEVTLPKFRPAKV